MNYVSWHLTKCQKDKFVKASQTTEAQLGI